MNMELHSTGASFVAGKNEHNPREFVVSVINTMPAATRKEQFDQFRALLQENPDEYQRAVDWYFFVNMHTYLTTDRNRTRDPVERTEAKQKQAQMVEAIKAQIVLLSLTMPNGKPMRDCTGAEMQRFGARYQRIAEKVGKAKLVGAVLSEEQVRTIMT